MRVRKLHIFLCASVLVPLACLADATTQTSTLPAPWFGPAGGTYTYSLTVAINESFPGMTMYYTTDGSTPSATHGTQYLGAIPVTASVTIKAIAVDPNSPATYSNSPVSTAAYVLNLPSEAPLPEGEWAWESGQNLFTYPSMNSTPCGGWTSGFDGTFGALGVSSDSNQPGSHFTSAHWTDKKGNLWMFGGVLLPFCIADNDLWMFDVTSRQWTWMSGNGFQNNYDDPSWQVLGTNLAGYVPVVGTTGNWAPAVYGAQGKFAPGNLPGGREGATGWTDESGNLWLFGGYGIDSTDDTQAFLNDLWEFDPTTRQWAFISGSKFVNQNGAYGYLHEASAGNTPGARAFPVVWSDRNGNFWLFGGSGYDATGQYGALNDLWEFNPGARQWAWMGGSHILNHPGVYGTHDKPSANNIPGARYLASGWTDAEGNFWLFGGDGYGAGTTSGILNDLWEFDPSNLYWTWAAGNAYAGTYPGTFSTGQPGGNGQAGVYGTLGVPDPGNNPGSRLDATPWTDAQGNLWLYGGLGFDSVGNMNVLDDQWEFDRSKWLWTWMGGSNMALGPNAFPDYGPYQVASPQTLPGPRMGALSWTDVNGNLWLFGGADGQPGPGDTTWFNDMLEYQLP
jgi:N-acetylneuraminic acid mutarotase